MYFKHEEFNNFREKCETEKSISNGPRHHGGCWSLCWPFQQWQEQISKKSERAVPLPGLNFVQGLRNLGRRAYNMGPKSKFWNLRPRPRVKIWNLKSGIQNLKSKIRYLLKSKILLKKTEIQNLPKSEIQNPKYEI